MEMDLLGINELAEFAFQIGIMRSASYVATEVLKNQARWEIRE